MFFLDNEIDETQIRAIGAAIVKEAKQKAKFDQGTLMRSIAFTYVKKVMIFRQIYYGVYYENSQLEKICKKKVPNGVPWKIVLTNFGGSTYETGKTRTGRASSRSVKLNIAAASTINIKALIKKRKARKAKEQRENGKTEE